MGQKHRRPQRSEGLIADLVYGARPGKKSLPEPAETRRVSMFRLAAIDQGSDQISRPNQADRGTRQRLEGWVAAIGQVDHVMAEMSEHTREIETGDPFPSVLVLPRAGWFGRSKREDPASELGQSRRADHDLIHAPTVLRLKVRENRPRHPSKSAKVMLQGDAALY
jgi:hypothetical protein